MQEAAKKAMHKICLKLKERADDRNLFLATIEEILVDLQGFDQIESVQRVMRAVIHLLINIETVLQEARLAMLPGLCKLLRGLEADDIFRLVISSQLRVELDDECARDIFKTALEIAVSPEAIKEFQAKLEEWRLSGSVYTDD
ncbi:hypothetical protein KKD19_01395 [Patescibacteria group bacterium]|nr:hypothetical protein [Patescibacteria group bacterium]MBU4511887.1 hypothetical protein [Patescibacteria group bacterium]MCG2692855.1 hypothetical protein [Candidatus Parcubacteria bacterium]